MNIALCKVNGKWQLLEMKHDILSNNIDENDISDIRCSYCNVPAHIVHDDVREWHFRAHHEPTCEIIRDGRDHKSHKVTDDTIIDDIIDIFHYVDHAPTIKPKTIDPKPGKHENPPKPQNEVDEIDSVISYGSRIIHTVGGLYNYALENGLDADLGNETYGRDLFLTARALRQVRRIGLNGMRIAITKRFSPNMLKHPFRIPFGYTCLCDAFAADIENAVFFLIRLRHKDQNSLFQSKIFGDKLNASIKDKHKNILLLGNWKECLNDYYNIYISDEMNSHCYKFVNYKELE